jgi:hypothetical protein
MRMRSSTPMSLDSLVSMDVWRSASPGGFSGVASGLVTGAETSGPSRNPCISTCTTDARVHVSPWLTDKPESYTGCSHASLDDHDLNRRSQPTRTW